MTQSKGCLTSLFGLARGLVLGVVLTIAGSLAWSAAHPSPRWPAAAQASSVRPDVIVTVEETYLNRRLATELDAVGAEELGRVAIDVQSGNRLVTHVEGELIVGRFTLSPQATLVSRLSARDAHLVLTVEQIEVANVPVPVKVLPGPLRTVLDTAEQAVNKAVTEAVSEQGLRVTRVQTGETTITVELGE